MVSDIDHDETYFIGYPFHGHDILEDFYSPDSAACGYFKMASLLHVFLMGAGVKFTMEYQLRVYITQLTKKYAFHVSSQTNL